MSAIVDLVVAGAKKLFDLVPLWLSASDEQKKQIEEKTREKVLGLDDIFELANKRDDANTAKMDDAIAEAEQRKREEEITRP